MDMEAARAKVMADLQAQGMLDDADRPAREAKAAAERADFLAKTTPEHIAATFCKWGYADRQLFDWPALFAAVSEIHRQTSRCRGLLLQGPPGTGKTMLAMMLRKLWSLDYRHAPALPARYEAGGVELREWDGGGDLLIDDLGAELQANNFGQRFELIGEILCARYARWYERNPGDQPPITVVTTNLDATGLRRYNERTLSRLRQMCQRFTFTGADQRQR